MSSGRHAYRWMLLGALCAAGPALGQDHAVGENLAGTKFSPFPGLPACTPGVVRSGDPAEGASVILAKAQTGCTVPWHWHSPQEHLMMVKGVARVEMRDGKPITLRPGGYAMLPAKHVHQFVCVEDCLFFVQSDAALDIHYVDDKGNEIPPEQALRKTGRKAPAGKR